MTLADLVSTPDNYLHSFEGDEAVFVPMDRAAYRWSIFLDARISPAADGAMRVPVDLLADSEGQSPPMGWIFHVAHCGSTLLARALEDLSGALVLKEPAALRQLGFAPDAARLDLVLTMLARRYYPADAPTVVKANVPVNFLLADIAARRPQDKAVVLYWTLADYLTAILRSDNHRQWLRGITDHFAAELALPEGASDAIRAAALWRGQAERFLALVQAMPQTRALDASLLFANPARAVASSAAHLGLPASPAEVERIVNGPLFATYSKRPDVAFDNADRLARAEAVSTAVAGEVESATAWLDGNDDAAGTIEAKLRGIALGG